MRRVFTTQKETEEWLQHHRIKDFYLAHNLYVTVHHSVDLSYKNLKELPVNFSFINGNFNISKNFLDSTDGFPKTVMGEFNCSQNKIKSLEGGPPQITGDYNCSYNPLKTLRGIARIGVESVYCEECKLASLEYCPLDLAVLNCSGNKLTSLEYCPEVHKTFYCGCNEITSLKHCPQELIRFDCSGNKLKSLEGGPSKVHVEYNCKYNRFQSLDGFPEEAGEFFCDDAFYESKEYKLWYIKKKLS